MTAVLTVRNGLPTLTAGATALLRTLDAQFEGWGTGAGAASLIMPPLLPVESLARLDVYENFPHQALVVAPLHLPVRSAGAWPAAFPPDALEPARLALPSAACFAVYLYHAGQLLPEDRTVTVLGRCFRREDHYEDLRRLIGFHMREIVALGSREFTQEHLDRFGERITGFAAALGLTMHREAATDPFYDRSGQRALLQRLTPVKHEYIVDGLAVASVNVHRNFFGERCDIRLAGTGEAVFTSCVAFGLERWVSVLVDRFGDAETAAAAVREAQP
jgi:hypothetical protein